MLTFLELYQTLLGFILFRLYLDAGLSYPPPLDVQRDQDAAGLGAFTLKEVSPANVILEESLENAPSAISGKKISGRAVREAIKEVGTDQSHVDDEPHTEEVDTAQEEEFVPQISSHTRAAELPTLLTLTSLASTSTSPLFEKLIFFLSRETPRGPFEFMIKSFGGRIGWHASQGAGSPFLEDDKSITHVIIDRPIVIISHESEELRLQRLRRKFVQPQWVVDCINAGKLLPEGLYEQGKTLPPHLSPFGERFSTYVPSNTVQGPSEQQEENENVDSDDTDTDNVEAEADNLEEVIDDPDMLQAAEIQAEVAGVDVSVFSKKIREAARRKAKAKTGQSHVDQEKDMNKMMMTNKQRKLYNKLKYTENKREKEVSIPEIPLVLFKLTLS
jgi:pescadillo